MKSQMRGYMNKMIAIVATPDKTAKVVEKEIRPLKSGETY